MVSGTASSGTGIIRSEPKDLIFGESDEEDECNDVGPHQQVEHALPVTVP